MKSLCALDWADLFRDHYVGSDFLVILFVCVRVRVRVRVCVCVCVCVFRATPTAYRDS